MNEPDRQFMARALALAARGQGHVEPNPMVGCVLAREGRVVGEGWHQSFGGPHAEVEAIRAAGANARGATMYVTLEPCCHHGKTPPCTQAILDAGVTRLVVALRDPFPAVDGGGIAQLEAAGVPVEVGVGAHDARVLGAPYLKLVTTGRPWVIAKWAMSLDGRIATRTGESRWISGEASRRIAHQLRGRVDAIVIGRGTAKADDPFLVARPPGARVAARVVADSQASLSAESQLVRTVNTAPVIVACAEGAENENSQRLADSGAEILRCPGETHSQRLESLLDELGRRRMTNLLVEGGGQLLGGLLDSRRIDEVHVFIAPKIIGGAGATAPVAGQGVQRMADALRLDSVTIEQVESDIYLSGRIAL